MPNRPIRLLAFVLASGLASGLAAGLTACGGTDKVDLDGDGGAADNDGGGGGGDGDGGGGGGGACTPTSAACNNCVDDDADGLTDGFDPECTGPLDDDEDSFETGIAGDNVDSRKQDCFFDGNSGGACQVDTCCLYPDGACPIDDAPNDCAFDQACIDECLPQVPPGCDCFGCCTVCVGDGCFDVLLNPAVTPDCTQETIGTDACPACQKIEDCSAGDCDLDPNDCVLCPGETADDLPAGCGGENACADGVTACPDGTGCGEGTYCQAGCCRAEVS